MIAVLTKGQSVKMKGTDARLDVLQCVSNKENNCETKDADSLVE